MRLDKLVAKTAYEQKIRVFDLDNEELFYLPDGECFEEYKKEMKHYKVMYFEVRNGIVNIEVKKKEV